MGNEIMLQQVLSLKIKIKIALVQLGAEAIQLPWESFEIIKEILALFSHWTGILESRNMVTISQVFVAYTALKNFLDAAQKINLSPFAADVVSLFWGNLDFYFGNIELADGDEPSEQFTKNPRLGTSNAP